MNSTLHAHRLYLLLTFVTAALLLTPGTAAGRTDVGGGDTPAIEVDAWVSGASNGSDKTSRPVQVDAWARGEASRTVVHDAWVSGRVRGSTTASSTSRVQPIPTSPVAPALLAVSLLSAAALGAMAAIAVGHRRRTPSAH